MPSNRSRSSASEHEAAGRDTRLRLSRANTNGTCEHPVKLEKGGAGGNARGAALDDSHVVVVAIVANVANEQNHCRVFQILPPMRRPVPFGANVAGLVNDRLGTIAGILDDLALGDVDERRTIVMAMPRHDSARLDNKLAEPQLAAFELCRLFLKIN